MATITAIGVGVALLILALVAITVGTRQSAKTAVRANGGPTAIFVATLAYLIVLAPVVTPSGITGVSMILLVVIAALPPIIGGLAASLRGRLGERSKRIYDGAGVVVAFALLTGVLATAGEVLSLFGGVNRSLAIAAIGICGAGYLYARGREASSRTSRWTVVIAFIIPVFLLAIGAALGSPATIVDSLVPYTPVPLGTAGALLAAVVAMSIVDPAVGEVVRGAAKPGKAALWGAVIGGAFTLVFSLGLILVYGGAFVAPSLQAFLLAAAPALILGYFMFMVAFVLASAGDSQLAAGSEVASNMSSPRRRRPITFAMVIVAILLAVFVPATGQIFVIASVVATAAVGSLLPALRGGLPNLNPVPGLIGGIVAGVVIALVMSVDATLTFRAATFVCLVVTFLIAAAVSFVAARKAGAPAAATA